MSMQGSDFGSTVSPVLLKGDKVKKIMPSSKAKKASKKKK